MNTHKRIRVLPCMGSGDFLDKGEEVESRPMKSDMEQLSLIVRAHNSELLKRAQQVIEDCHRVLIESGQFEVKPPQSLVFFLSEKQGGISDED